MFVLGRCLVVTSLALFCLANPATASLIAYYNFDADDVSDSSTYSNDGAANSGISYVDSQDGFGRAASFNGSNGLISLNNTDLNDFDMSSFTFSAWIKPESRTGYNGIFRTSNGNIYGEPGFGLQLDSDSNLETAFRTRQDAPKTELHARTINYADGDWHNVVYTRDSAAREAKIFVDGVESASASFSDTNDIEFNRSPELGHLVYVPSGRDDYYHGLMDEVAIFDSALSEAEIAQIVSGPSPTLSELGQMAECAYSGTCLIPGYNTVDIGSLVQAPDTFSAVALVNNEGNQVVLSITGTDDLTDWLKVNPTFIDRNGEPTDKFRDYVKAAADYLIELSNLYPNAEITLTGHSLGGALAQLLAQETGFPATTFNAPGAAETIRYLDDELSGLDALPNPIGTLGDTNYRIYGDLVSTIGTPIGSTVTYEPAIPKWQVDYFPGGTAKPMHEMLFVNERIFDNAPTTDEVGPTASEVGWNTVLDLSDAIISGPASLIAPITSLVVAGQQIWVDPENYDMYEFSAEPGSPNVRSVIFPFVTQFDALFNLQIFDNNNWLSLGYLDELSEYDFGLDGIDMFRFFILDASTLEPPLLVEPLTFGMTFVSDGQMSGVVTATNTRFESSVPEPSVLALMVIGFFGIAFVRRRPLKMVA